jgi:hypothetical protein
MGKEVPARTKVGLELRSLPAIRVRLVAPESHKVSLGVPERERDASLLIEAKSPPLNRLGRPAAQLAQPGKHLRTLRESARGEGD